jgi:hypothetical protein
MPSYVASDVETPEQVADTIGLRGIGDGFGRLTHFKVHRVGDAEAIQYLFAWTERLFRLLSVEVVQVLLLTKRAMSWLNGG